MEVTGMALYVSFECESCENENCTGKWLKSTVYKCSGYKHKQTNADRIRAGSNEHIAGVVCTGCPPGVETGKQCTGDGACYDCWLDWLKQEARDG